MIEAVIKDCNNVTSATIQIRKNHLNMRYAMNGTGKSTIASAIELQSKQEDLSRLKCFGSTDAPTCTLSEPVKVLLFNEDFVKSFVFQQSEVIQNSFDVFIKTPEYETRQASINKRLKEIHLDLVQNADLQQVVSVGKTVLSRFTLTQSGELKNIGLLKTLKSSQSIFTLPEKLSKFQPLMQKEYNVEWVGWKHDGSKFDDNGICPFCTSGLGKEYVAEKEMFNASYTRSNVKNIREMLSYFQSVQDFMDEEKRAILIDCVKGDKGEREIQLWITKFYNELNFLVSKITDAQDFNSFRVRREDIPHLDQQLNALIIDTSNLQIFNNQKVKDCVDFLNGKIKAVLGETELLKSDIGQLKGLIGSAKEQAIKDINEFLLTAGINYKFEIRDESENVSKTILSYISRTTDPIEVEDINLHLSWGEKNAFALVLFMHYALSQNPQLIILDDPISSFDSNKKYAIISRLFSSKRRSFYRKTVFMLTHDLQPIIDYVINEKPTGKYVSAYFIQNRAGVVSELEISEPDIRSLLKMLVENARDDSLNKVHRVASLRKFFDHVPAQSVGQDHAYSLLSCLIHGKPKATMKDGSEMTAANIASGEAIIKQYISDFDYSTYLINVFTKEPLLRIIMNDPNSYFRLQAFRVLLQVLNLKSKIADDALMKYIDEQFHVENDYIFTLDYVKYDTVPDFVIPRCLEFLKKEGLVT
jgi:ABC-type dipeptide/oligopeptide/nickel transport system ATPase subunit